MRTKPNVKCVYHATSASSARSILKRGFRDIVTVVDTLTLRGVFLSDKPLDVNDGARKSDVVLKVTISALTSDWCDWELVESGKPYREWCIPSCIVNRGKVSIATVEDES